MKCFHPGRILVTNILNRYKYRNNILISLISARAEVSYFKFSILETIYRAQTHSLYLKPKIDYMPSDSSAENCYRSARFRSLSPQRKCRVKVSLPLKSIQYLFPSRRVMQTKKTGAKLTFIGISYDLC